jgi:hypothetical protein
MRSGCPSLPKQWHAVGPESHIAGHQRESLYSSLSDEQPVERVSMMKRHHEQFLKMFEFRRQCMEAIRNERAWKKIRIGNTQLQLSQADLDCEFPGRDVAYVLFVVRFFDSSTSGRAQSGTALPKPKERVAVQKQPHSMNSSKSASGSSKSGASLIFPARQPKWGRAVIAAASTVAMTLTVE